MLSGLFSLSFEPASGPVVSAKSVSPVCPDCHSTLNRVPRRFIDRLLSLVYPVHRYRCRSFDCNWEGNLRYTAALGYWEAPDAHSDSQSPPDYRGGAPAPHAVAPDLPNDDPRIDERREREGDTLPMPRSLPPKTKKPDARAEPRDGTNAPRRARKRAKAAPR